MIKLEKINKYFQTEEVQTQALKDVNLHVKEGEFIAIMGPSGCGKSTLLNVIGLLESPTSGSYQLDGKEVADYKESQRTNLRKGNIGFVFQNFHLINQLTVSENVMLPLAYLDLSKTDRKKKVEDVLDRLKISHRRNHYPQQLSGGQQQRVGICRAVVAQPKLILADEPTGNLDSKNGQEVMELLTELNRQGATIVMVTHSQRDANYAHRVISLLDGEIVTEVENEIDLF
ncbi:MULTISPECIES: ABC transporter ATP-binding protein [Flammeovirga]|uniref:ABC transporter ATP-binding protein n=1 Tax=Flammeovirga agarivorans TaxID=2726742 RepID=A0A7X8XX11_9BACT|nr:MULTISPECIES: ABC transporter ATP-binding protein [Flammeovirga]NLR92808.1 ABC transporter ATP-binding protein [Flammeovirga agarivorans]